MTKPKKVFRAGNCSASIFVNKIKKDGKDIEIPKIVFDIGYKDDKGKWQSTNSLSLHEVPKVVLVLEMAYEWQAMNPGAK